MSHRKRDHRSLKTWTKKDEQRALKSLGEWTQKHEEQLQAGRAQGWHPGVSQNGNVLCCAFDNCTDVAFEEFSLTVFSHEGIQEIWVFCGPGHQAAQLHTWGEI
jgi:hypothetical protein